MTAWSAQHNGKFPDPFSKLKLDHEKNKDKKKKKKKDKHHPLEEKPENYQHKQHIDATIKTVKTLLRRGNSVLGNDIAYSAKLACFPKV